MPIDIVLDVQGMTCASCVNRIERYLKRTDGVLDASVNLATERATVTVDASVAGRRELVRAVEAAGYDVRPAVDVPPLAGNPARDRDAERASEQRELGIQAAAVHRCGHRDHGPDGTWTTAGAEHGVDRPAGAHPGTRSSRSGPAAGSCAPRSGPARHGSVTMDTLVAIGTTAAWGYSVVVTVWPEVMTQAGLEPAAYFDSSTIIIGLILAGRWLEARARSSTAGAVRALMALQPPTAHRIDGDAGDGSGVEVDVPVAQVRPADLLRVRAGETIPVDGAARRGRLERQRVDDHRRVDARDAARR